MSVNPSRAAQRPRKAQTIELPAGSRVRQAAHAAIAEGRAHFLHNARDLRGDSDPERVHQTRVALRRLRVFVRLFRAQIGRARAERLEAELRWLFQPLGALRDLQLFSRRLARQRAASERGAAAFRARLARQLDAEQRALNAALASPRARSLQAELASLERELAAPAEQDERARRFLARRLDKRRKRALRSFEAVLRRDVPELHRLRKQLKKLRYTAELARPLYPGKQKRARALLRCIGELQDLLGALVDAQVARALLERARAPRALRARLEASFAQREQHSLAALEAGFQGFADVRPFWA